MFYQASNVTEAVKMAEAMKREGTHEWFRGQTHNWTLQSSLNRFPDQREQSVNRLRTFSGWLKVTPGLEHLRDDVDGSLAIAQHYGLPTHFIDFSTEPYIAGYFASENTPVIDPDTFNFDDEQKRFFGSKPATDKVGCIICLNKEDLLDVWKMVASAIKFPDEATPEFLNLHVRDLWRLEAQHGVFFYCPLNNFEEKVYDLDRIVFPHSGQIIWPPKELIYPDRKSTLEILLAEYFLLERISDLKKVQHDAGLTRLLGTPLKISNKRTTKLPVHSSWNNDILVHYINSEQSNFFDSLSEICWPISYSQSDAPNTIAHYVKVQILDHIKVTPSARMQLITWQTSTPKLDAVATKIWDGLRLLPCSNESIATAIGNSAGLISQSLLEPNKDALEICNSFYQDPAIEVEFGTSTGGFSRAYISKSSLLNSFRDDIEQFLNPEKREFLLERPSYILIQFLNPNQMFPFDRFEKLFLHEVIPSQVVWWSKLNVLFSPARISVFGLP